MKQYSIQHRILVCTCLTFLGVYAWSTNIFAQYFHYEDMQHVLRDVTLHAGLKVHVCLISGAALVMS